MKKAFLTTALLSGFLACASFSALADPAVVIKPDGGCALFDGNRAFAFTTNTQITATQSPNGNSTFKCQANVTPSSSGQAVQWNQGNTGALCGIDNPFGFQVTDDWHETVSASGQATLICQVHPN